MPTSALRPNRFRELASSLPVLSVDEVEPWIREVGPVLDVLLQRTAAPSAGQRQWLTDQVDHGTHALILLECEWYEAEAADQPCGELQWLHTRVAVLVEAAQTVLAQRAAA